jgi:hypothetical protein
VQVISRLVHASFDGRPEGSPHDNVIHFPIEPLQAIMQNPVARRSPPKLQADRFVGGSIHRDQAQVKQTGGINGIFRFRNDPSALWPHHS